MSEESEEGELQCYSRGAAPRVRAVKSSEIR